MQGKGIIKLFLVLMLMWIVLQFFFMSKTNAVEADADTYASEIAASISEKDEAYVARKIARSQYLDSISTEKILTIPGFASYTYNDLKSKQIAFGLDLKGGMSSVLQVNLKELLVNLSNKSKDPTFLKALDQAEEALKNSQSDYITLFRNEYEDVKTDDSKSLATIFMRNQGLREDLNVNSTDGEVVRLLRTKADEAVNLTFQMLKQRIDKLGVANPTVTLDQTRDLILVEMPGIENAERARTILQSTAKLEFWNTYRFDDPGIMPALVQADAILKRESAGIDSLDEEVALMDTIWTATVDSLGNMTGDSTFELVEKQVDPFDDQGPLLRMLTPNNGVFARNALGVADKNKKNAVMAYLNRPDIQGLFPTDLKFLWGQNEATNYESGEVTEQFELYMIKMESGKEEAPLDGGVVTRATSGPDPSSGEMGVNLSMNSKGAKVWADLTRAAAAAGNREIAIALDDNVVSAPRVNGPIEGGNSLISGSFSVQEATDLASILEVGKLPTSLESIQEKTVGPSLGQKNINSSVTAMIAGFALLLAFMIFYYGGAGVIAIFALLLNLLFIFGSLASFGTVLTLPGIAGIILTIGMAVDVNVIIFERVKEELRAGKSNLAAISDGFKNSYSAIIDANVTTILVAIVLAYFGLGPIKGFAVVLIIGVLCSLFTALLVGKMIVDWWTGGDRNLSFWIPPTKNAFANLKIDWIGKRKIAYMVSGLIIAGGLVSIFTKSFDLGVDFKGGYSYDVQFSDDVSTDAETLRNGLESYFGSKPVVKEVDTDNTYNIVTDYKIEETGEDIANQVIDKLHEGIAGITNSGVTLDQFKLTDTDGTHVISSSKVGPTIADDIKKSSFYAGAFALILVFFYIFIRFNKWQYSLGAVAALFHDSLVVLGLFSILWGIVPFSLQIDQAFIAAILTVIGYSINDTVVVFDRVREYLGIYTNKSTDEVLNLAINSTFSRTIITSITTLIVIVALFIFGGGSIKGFAFALLIGVIVGTYSSIFVATPIVRDLSDELKPKSGTTKKSFSRAASSK